MEPRSDSLTHGRVSHVCRRADRTGAWGGAGGDCQRDLRRRAGMGAGGALVIALSSGNLNFNVYLNVLRDASVLAA